MNDDQTASSAVTTHSAKTADHIDMTEALIIKRETLLRQLKELDAAISQVQQEYARRVEELQAQKKPAEEALNHVEALLKLEGASLTARPSVTNESEAIVGTGTTSAIDAAHRLLEERHQPMHYKEIAKNLQERLIYIPGKDPAATLLSKMTRDSRFRRTSKRGTYALSTWRVRAAKPKSPGMTKTKGRR